MKKSFITRTMAFHLLKIMYIITILCALSLLRLALLRGEVGYGFVNEAYLRPICDDLIICNFLLTLLGIMFIEGS